MLHDFPEGLEGGVCCGRHASDEMSDMSGAWDNIDGRR